MLEFRGIRVLQTPSELRTILEGVASSVVTHYKSATISEIPEVKAVRTIFHRTGVDPTRYRPSSEALLRRVLKGKGLYFINSVVDVVNYFSLKTLLPMGVFDADRLKPPLEFRAGRDGETYQGVGRDVLRVSRFWRMRTGPSAVRSRIPSGHG